MKVCKHCGLIRPDSQTTCDCSAPERRFDPRPPAGWSTAALATTAAVEIAIVTIARSLNSAGLGGIGLAFLMCLLVGVGVVIVAFAGTTASRRGEAGAGRIAILGIVLMVGTVILLLAR